MRTCDILKHETVFRPNIFWNDLIRKQYKIPHSVRCRVNHHKKRTETETFDRRTDGLADQAKNGAAKKMLAIFFALRLRVTFARRKCREGDAMEESG